VTIDPGFKALARLTDLKLQILEMRA